MESIYILEPGAYLRRDGDSLRVVKGGEDIDRIPAAGLKRLLLVGYVTLTGAVLDFLIRNRVETVFVTPTGRFRARLGLDEHRHVALRRDQYLGLNDPKTALAAARRVVCGKLDNLSRFLRRRAGKDEDLRSAVLKIQAMSAHAAESADLAILRGVEGAGARVYFSAFPRLIKNDSFSFNGRNRRPPKDPVNALLSFVYTLLTNEVLSAIQTAGLDPYLGALHEISYGRPSLACDLVEEYRPFLGDRLVLGLINRRAIRPEDFILRPNAPQTYRDEAELKARRPVEMKPAVARDLIAAYETMMNRSIYYPPLEKKVTHRGLILNQVRRFGTGLSDPDAPYEPFLWKV